MVYFVKWFGGMGSSEKGDGVVYEFIGCIKSNVGLFEDSDLYCRCWFFVWWGGEVCIEVGWVRGWGDNVVFFGSIIFFYVYG